MTIPISCFCGFAVGKSQCSPFSDPGMGPRVHWPQPLGCVLGASWCALGAPWVPLGDAWMPRGCGRPGSRSNITHKIPAVRCNSLSWFDYCYFSSYGLCIASEEVDVTMTIFYFLFDSAAG